ncbi:protein KAKU4-like isoform X2 [Salvia hispanica]|uniref:protein KAKU4-like isoform X2 n=1 Tax=Salvia hispanica TaxID=49212 RepID=UPI002008FE49|nr:protein KAKU4-like isoform X2 [Salvia hispanica]
MASPPDSRSGAGGKMVTNRRRQRLAATPYDRPLPSPSLKSPNWLTGVVIPSARALASGAGKFISSAIFSDSESSSSEDFDSASEDGADNINEYESPRDGVNALNEEKLTGGEMKEYGRESQLSMQRSETKWLIEQLIMQENFSREECDRLTKVLHSRVNHWSVETGDKRSIANSPRKTDEDPYILNKAVQEARNWFQEKKGGSSSVAEFAHGTCNLNSAAIDHMEIGAGSPVDMARSYMKERPPWASPTEHVELRTPLTTTMKLFKERTPYSVTEDILSSSQRRSSLASESWNIQEELRKVRSKAVEDMLRTPPAKYDSSFSIAATKEESMGAGGVGEEIFKSHFFWKTKPIDAFMDVGVNADPALVALESRQDAKGSETPSSHPDASASEIIKDPETIPNDGVHAPSKLSHPTSPVHTDQHSADPHAAKIGGPPETGVAEPGGSPCTNGFTPAQASSPEAVGAQNSKQYDVENHNDAASNKNMPTNGTTNMDGNCELLTEADMEVPTVTETESINSGSHISVDMQNEESQLETTQPSAEEKPEVVMTAKQQAKKVGRTTRRSNRTKGK